MNTWNGSGFITKDPDIKTITTKSGEQMSVASFSIACQRKGKDAGADYVSCKAFGKNAEMLEKWFGRGKGIEVRGHIQTGSYEGKNGKVYTTDVICDEIEFAKARKNEESTPVEQGSYDTPQIGTHTSHPQSAPDSGFMDIPEDLGFDNLPFR